MCPGAESQTEIEDVIIVGGGPAAHAAALYISCKQPLMFEGEIIGDIGPGGQLTTTTDVDNYPGFPNGVQGPDLMEIMRKESESRGVRIVGKTVMSVEKLEERDRTLFRVHIKDRSYLTRSLIVATGASAKRLYVPGTNEGEFWQRGISACAVCDGFFFRNKVVAVIGGGDSAMEDVLYLSNIAKKVYLIHRRNEFRARKDKIAKVRGVENVEIIQPAVLQSAYGDEVLGGLKIEMVDSSDVVDLKVDGLFFAIGHIPNVQFLNGMVELRENGYIKAYDGLKSSAPGIFVCGDVQDYVYRQAVTAAADGCIAAKSCMEYLNK